MKQFILVFFVSLLILSCDKKQSDQKETVVPNEKVQQDTVVSNTVKPKPIVVKEPVIRFSVQIGAFKKYGAKIGNIPNVNSYQKDGYQKFSLGSFDSYQEARKYMYSIEEDYPDAFVQALKDGDPISIQKALKK